MTEKYADGKVPPVSKNEEVAKRVLETWKEYQKDFENFNIKSAIERVFLLLNFANEYIEKNRPWEMAKTNPTDVLKVLYDLLEIIRHASMMLLPYMPETAAKIQASLNVEHTKLYPDNINWGMLKEGSSVKKGDVLFPRRD